MKRLTRPAAEAIALGARHGREHGRPFRRREGGKALLDDGGGRFPEHCYLGVVLAIPHPKPLCCLVEGLRRGTRVSPPIEGLRAPLPVERRVRMVRGELLLACLETGKGE